MNDIVQKARAALKKAQTDLDFAKGQVERLERNCLHKWSEPKYDPIVVEGCYHPGDRPGDPGYGGVDRQLPFYSPTTKTDRWTRDCSECGKHEETRSANIEKVEKKTPRF